MGFDINVIYQYLNENKWIDFDYWVYSGNYSSVTRYLTYKAYKCTEITNYFYIEKLSVFVDSFEEYFTDLKNGEWNGCYKVLDYDEITTDFNTYMSRSNKDKFNAKEDKSNEDKSNEDNSSEEINQVTDDVDGQLRNLYSKLRYTKEEKKVKELRVLLRLE